MLRPLAGAGAFLLFAAGIAGGSTTGTTQLLGNLVDAKPSRSLAVVSRYNITPVVEVFVSVQGTDLGSTNSVGAAYVVFGTGW